MNKINVLHINESSLPKHFKNSTVTGKELRLIKKIKIVDKIFAISRGGDDFVRMKNLKNDKNESKIKVIHIPFLRKNKTPFYYPLTLFVALKVIKNHRIDLIQAESPVWSGTIAVIMGKIFKKPVVIEIRSDYKKLLKHYYKYLPLFLKKILLKWILKFSLKNADLILANSKFHKREFQKDFKLSKVEELNPGIRFSDKEIARFKKIRDKVYTIGFVGRVVKLKGIDYLLKSIDYILKKYNIKKFKVIIVGDGEDREYFTDLTKELRLTNFVEFVGYQNNLEYMAKLDVLVNPSIEVPALDMANAEAYTCKIPVIASGERGIPETVLDNKTGFIVKPKNFEMLGDKIFFLYKHPKIRKIMGQRGYDYLKSKYLFEAQAKKLEKWYGDLVK